MKVSTLSVVICLVAFILICGFATGATLKALSLQQELDGIQNRALTCKALLDDENTRRIMCSTKRRVSR